MKIGLIGYGNLARAFVNGLKLADAKEEILVTAKSDETKILARTQGLIVYDDPNELVKKSDLVILALPSKGLETLMQSGFSAGSVPVISFVAGLAISSIREKIRADHVCRIIPNIAMGRCASVSTVAWGDFPLKEAVLRIFGKIGHVVEANEDQLDVITSLSSSGIAFAAKYMEGFEKKGIEMGLSEEQAVAVTTGTFEGAIRLIEAGMNPGALVRAVATKGGSTFEGILQMEAEDTDGITSRTVDRAYEKLMRFKQGQDLH